MSRAALAAALCAAFISGCGNDPPPPRARPAAAPASPRPIEEEEKPSTPTNIYVYSPIGKRDPFQAFTVSTGASHVQDKGRTKTPLEKWDLDQLKLTMTMTGTSTPLAVVEDPNRRGWTVRLGDFIGKNSGKVTGIQRDVLVVTETITDHATGRVYPQNVKLQVPVTKEEERDLLQLQEGEQLSAAGK